MIRLLRSRVPCVLALLTFGGSSLLADTIRYSITNLGTLGGNSTATAINNSGQVVGSSYLSNGEPHPFIWHSDSGMRDLGTRGSATDINNNGQVVGRSVASGNAFLWQSETGIQDLGRLAGGSSASAINDSVQVAGSSDGRAFLWQSSTGMQYLNTAEAAADSSYVGGMNNSGQVVGVSFTWSVLRQHAFLWQSGTGMQDLGTLGGRSSHAWAINDNGQVVGVSDTSLNQRHAFLWQSGTGMQDIGPLIGTTSHPDGINNNGQIVGSNDGHAVLFEDGQVLDLNDLVATDSGWVLYQASAINDLGQIVGLGSFGGSGRAVLLTPVPEPATCGLCGLTLIGIVLVRQRKRRRVSRAQSETSPNRDAK